MNIDFKNPSSVKKLIDVLNEQLNDELDILQEFKKQISHIFIDNNLSLIHI